jgi:hypothetical protein
MESQVEVLTFGPMYDNTPEIGHGAGVMSIIHEIAPKARIVYFPFNNVRSEQKMDMLEWIIEHSEEIDWITMSLNWYPPTAHKYFDVIRWLKIPFTVASGNDGETYENSVDSPADFDYTLAVGAATNGFTGRTHYSNGGKDLMCIAPIILAPNATNPEFSRSGTSFATPFVSGAGLLYSAWRRKNKLSKLTHDDAVELIKTYALDITSERFPEEYKVGFDYATGWGLFRLPDKIEKLEPIIEEPVIEEPIIEEPIIEEPIEEEPIVIQPEPTTWFFTVQKTWDDQQSSIGKFVVMSQAVEFAKLNPGYNVYDATGYLVYKGLPAPIIEEPVVEEPIVEEPIIEEPVIEEPIIEEPIIEEPVVEEPIIEEPTPEPAPDLNLIYKLLLQILEFLKKIFIK